MIEIPEQAASLHMSMVILWTNGNIMVFDDLGQQMSAYQGSFEAKAPLINVVFRGAWKYGDWNAGIITSVPLPMLDLSEDEP